MKMNQNMSSSKVKKRQCICFYNSQQNQEDQYTKHKAYFENMPMLSRATSSNIKFKNVQHNNKQHIYQLLNQLYANNGDPSSLYALLSNKRINPVIQNNQQRDDLQFFIPQIITFVVIQKNLSDQKLVDFILKGCLTDFYFAHRVYFYLKSLSEDHLNQKIQNVENFINNIFLEKMDIYTRCKLAGVEFVRSMIEMDPNFKNKRKFSEEIDLYEKIAIKDMNDQQMGQNIVNNEVIEQTILGYGTKDYPNPLPDNPPTVLKVNRKRYCQNGFIQTPQFWQDLIAIGNKISKTAISQRSKQLNNQIQKINAFLPANVYIPFFKDQIRLYSVLCVWKGHLFATKERAPYSIWVQIYREEEQINLQILEQQNGQQEYIIQQNKKESKRKLLEKIHETLSKPFSINGGKNTLNFKKFLTEKASIVDDSIMTPKKITGKKSLTRSFANKDRCSLSDVYDEKQIKSEKRKSTNQPQSKQIIQKQSQQGENLMDEYFGKKHNIEIEQRKRKSIYRQLKSWKLIHLMIKTGDDIKQQQFAMQLVNQFQQIFKKQKIDCVVFPYEVISLGPNYGLIEMLNEVSTLNRIFEKLHTNQMSLKDFFNRAFPDPVKAKENFMKSLAGYSILTYFLQVKDRHNGNILLNRQGYIIHIDFGFLLSNAPGKGVQLQKKVPFKLLGQYVEVIGQFDSKQYFEFRRLFYKGFSAVLKNKEKIIALVKMMYSSHGQSMGCFIKGQLAIEELQRRFEINGKVQSFCLDLISSSLDNWRARWYDKFQYYLQKIWY